MLGLCLSTKLSGTTIYHIVASGPISQHLPWPIEKVSRIAIVIYVRYVSAMKS